MKGSTLKKIIFREFKRIGERKTLFLLEIIFPIFIFILFSEIYKEEVIRELPVAVFDIDNTNLSRKFSWYLDSSPTLKVIDNVNSIDEIKNMFKKGKIQGAFVFPKDFEKDAKSGKSSSIVTYKNSSNLLVGTYILKESSTIINTIAGSATLKKLISQGKSKESAMAIVNPIRIETASLYNPTYSYENYLMPGLVTFIFQMLIMLAAVIVISSEFSHETFGELIKFADNKAYKILIGKCLPHLLIHLSTIVLILGIIFPLYNIEINGSIMLLFGLLVIFVFASFMLGILISTIFNDQLFATEIAVFINTPAFIFSGFTFPIWGMPFIHTVFAQILPYTHFLSAFLKVYQMGAAIGYVFNEIIILSLFGIGSIIISLIVLRLKMNSANKKLKLSTQTI